MTLPAFDNSYLTLPERFYARVNSDEVSAPHIIMLNRALASDLGLDVDWLSRPEGLDFLTGRTVVAGSEPIATAYAGHQFGNFVPQLGDGRAILLGEVVDSDGTAPRHAAEGRRAARRSRAAATDARRSVPCCANISSARPWLRSASRRRARSRPRTTGEQV